MCYLCGNNLITGDTLFAETVGRTDLYGGNAEILEASLEMLRSLDLDKNIPIFPGHGPDGTLGTALDIAAYLF